jgi:uncharacterized phosphosugar-binding protein
MSAEEVCIRMGALTGFHPLLQGGLTTFGNVVGVNGIRLCQSLEKVEGLGKLMLGEFDIAPGEPLLVVTATGQTPAAVDMALAWVEMFPENPIIGLCCLEQSRTGAPKHSSGKNLTHIIESARAGILLNNGMPYGDLSVHVTGQTGEYDVCPLSSIGALSVIQSLNELTLRELDRRGIAHQVLRNMHTGSTGVNYDAWLRDQRRRYARALHQSS